MVISLRVTQAREYLQSNGFVYTFRQRRRKHLGKDWANKGRGMKKEFDVIIEEVGAIDNENIRGGLRPYAEHSGFGTENRWLRAIIGLGHFQFEGEGWLYKVTLKRSNGSETE